MHRRVGRRATLGRPLPPSPRCTLASQHCRRCRARCLLTYSLARSHARGSAGEPRARALHGARADDGEAASPPFPASRPRFHAPASQRMLLLPPPPPLAHLAVVFVPSCGVSSYPVPRRNGRRPEGSSRASMSRASERRHGLSSHQPRRLLFLCLSLSFSVYRVRISLPPYRPRRRPRPVAFLAPSPLSACSSSLFLSVRLFRCTRCAAAVAFSRALRDAEIKGRQARTDHDDPYRVPRRAMRRTRARARAFGLSFFPS